MPSENNYYNGVILSDPTLTLDNPVAGHEIQVIVGRGTEVSSRRDIAVRDATT